MSFAMSPYPAVGASGAIFGLMGAMVEFGLRNEKLLGNQYGSFMSTLLMNAGINFAFGMTPGSRVDNFGHLGGFLGGLVISFLVGPRYKTIGYDRSGRQQLVDEPLYKSLLKKFSGRD
mmetsp:Transcript_18908/g.47524  ORF Transcript_18908/g.47524 Transcript_18908/m.47524 type:complete len:118 (+) Transcript_18908:1-354(+)